MWDVLRWEAEGGGVVVVGEAEGSTLSRRDDAIGC